jgi:D-sedoheptulose 7-phosphate isomerase
MNINSNLKELNRMSENLITIKNYLFALTEVIEKLPVEKLAEITELLQQARENQATIFICGNGGSWATAAHMVCDFGKNTRKPDKKRMRVIGLGDNIPSLTAYANDEGYDRVFAEPLMNLMQPGDVLIAISGSGNSPNILEAVKTARQFDGVSVGLTGFEGGQLKDLVDYPLVIPSDSMEVIEDFHMIVDHIMTLCLRQ